MYSPRARPTRAVPRRPVEVIRAPRVEARHRPHPEDTPDIDPERLRPVGVPLELVLATLEPILQRGERRDAVPLEHGAVGQSERHALAVEPRGGGSRRRQVASRASDLDSRDRRLGRRRPRQRAGPASSNGRRGRASNVENSCNIVAKAGCGSFPHLRPVPWRCPASYRCPRKNSRMLIWRTRLGRRARSAGAFERAGAQPPAVVLVHGSQPADAFRHPFRAVRQFSIAELAREHRSTRWSGRRPR